jgi:group I intron endonuclease
MVLSVGDNMPTIYAIRNVITNQRYVGKTINLKRRWCQHSRHLLNSDCHKDFNRHLFNSAKKYGIANFVFEVLEYIEIYDECILKERELYWMDFYNTCDRKFGYNLRRDSATNCYHHEETKIIFRIKQRGSANGNYGNKWSVEQKEKMSKIAKDRHNTGNFYTDSWKEKISKKSKLMWKDEDKKQKMAQAVKIAKRKYIFDQFTRDDVFIKTWGSVDEILLQHPTWKWQNIYSVCNGYKPTYMNFKWKKREK